MRAADAWINLWLANQLTRCKLHPLKFKLKKTRMHWHNLVSLQNGSLQLCGVLPISPQGRLVQENDIPIFIMWYNQCVAIHWRMPSYCLDDRFSSAGHPIYPFIDKITSRLQLCGLMGWFLLDNGFMWCGAALFFFLLINCKHDSQKHCVMIYSTYTTCIHVQIGWCKIIMYSKWQIMMHVCSLLILITNLNITFVWDLDPGSLRYIIMRLWNLLNIMCSRLNVRSIVC